MVKASHVRNKTEAAFDGKRWSRGRDEKGTGGKNMGGRGGRNGEGEGERGEGEKEGEREGMEELEQRARLAGRLRDRRESPC